MHFFFAGLGPSRVFRCEIRVGIGCLRCELGVSAVEIIVEIAGRFKQTIKGRLRGSSSLENHASGHKLRVFGWPGYQWLRGSAHEEGGCSCRGGEDAMGDCDARKWRIGESGQYGSLDVFQWGFMMGEQRKNYAETDLETLGSAAEDV